MAMNRKQRRKAQKQGLVPAFDPNTRYRFGYDIKVPGGLLRSQYPAQQSGAFEAASEVDLFRGAFVKLVETFGFLQHEAAIVGLLSSVVNVFPKHMRGRLAFAIIQGQGLIIDTDMVTVCAECGTEKQRTLAPPEQQPPTDTFCPTDECIFMTEEDGVGSEDRVRKEWCDTCGPLGPDFPHDSDEEAVMLDTTVHTPTCSSHNKTVDEVEYREMEAAVILTPPMYEPLNAPEEKETEPPTDEEREAAAIPEPVGQPNTEEAEDTARLY